MFKFKQTFIAAFLLCLGASGISSSGERSPIDRFTFDYAVSGDLKAKPLQVFDDGKKTYLQYRSNQDIPAFISSSTGELMMPTQEGPYTVLNGVPRDFVASMGSSMARITHARAMSNAAQYVTRTSQTAVPTERIQPQVLVASAQQVASIAPRFETRNDWSSNSYATPTRGDQVAWSPSTSEASKVILFERGSSKLTRDLEQRAKKMASEVVGASRVVISASDDAKPGDVGGSERVRVVRNYLVAAGVDPSVISSKVGFLFDEQLQKVGSKLMNPVTITWFVQSAPSRERAMARGVSGADDALNVVAMLRAGRISPAQAVQMLQAAAAPNVSQGSPTLAATKSAMPTSWSVRKDDQTVERMLARWASDAGWRVVWKGAPAVQITADSERPLAKPDFVQAADYVITQAKAAGYHISATAYSDRVLVVTGE